MSSTFSPSRSAGCSRMQLIGVGAMSRLRSSSIKKLPEPLRRAIADCLSSSMASSLHHGNTFSTVVNEASRTLWMELPEWTNIVKTARFKELAPYDLDWYYVRAASMARKIYLRGGLGVGTFQMVYGGSQRNGSRPPHFCKSNRAIARHIL